MRPALYTLLPLLTLLTLPAIAHACPYCADTIHHTDAVTGANAASVGSAFNLSIYCMFLGLFCGFGIVLRAVMKGISKN